ncbi:MAG: Hpt domain-containing protein, partial [Curvibacter sp.]
LKGSSRMVGFNEFGEAAWAMEQMMNSWLAEQKPARPELLQLSNSALQGLGQWVEDIAAGQDAGRSAAAFRQSADAMRLDGQLIPLPDTAPVLALPDSPALDVAAPAPPTPSGVDFVSTQMFDFQLDDGPASAPPADPALALGDVSDIDFGSLAQVPPAAPVAASTPPVEFSLDWPATGLAPAAAAAEAMPDLSFSLDETPVPPVPSAEPVFELPELQNNWADTTTGAEEESVRDQGPDSKVPAIDGFEFDLQPPTPTQAPAEEQVKVIGSLRIGIPLYNVFLNEADEWSRRLVTELNEWSLELHNPVPDSAIALAHSLGGSSATVGFKALSEIARALEQAMQHVQLHRQGQPGHAQTFVAAADNIRHLLHQFAAGFLKSPEPGLVEALQAIVGTEFGPLDVEPGSGAAALTVTESPDLDLGDLDFDFTSQAVTPVPRQQVAPAPRPVAPLPGAAQIVAEDSDEDIDAIDVIDPDLFPIFEEEAAELMPQLASALRQWSGQPDDGSARLDVLRVLHTLKGSARLAGAMRLGEMAHRMESAIEQMGSDYVQAAQIEPMLARYDRLQEAFDELCR